MSESGCFIVEEVSCERPETGALYVILRIPLERYQSFKLAQKKKIPFTLTQYGEVLAYGTGDSAPESVRSAWTSRLSHLSE